MAIKISQGMKQQQNLAMTPQLQQAIKLLTLTHLEMTNVIAEELVENPMLEELGGESDSNESSEQESQAELDVREATSEDFQEAPLLKDKDDRLPFLISLGFGFIGLIFAIICSILRLRRKKLIDDYNYKKNLKEELKL